MSESCNLFIIWGDPTKPDSAEIDEASFYDLMDVEQYVNEQRHMTGEKRSATIMEAVESNDGGKWRKI